MFLQIIKVMKLYLFMYKNGKNDRLNIYSFINGYVKPSEGDKQSIWNAK